VSGEPEAAAAPQKKRRAVRATVASAAVKIVEALRGNRYTDGFRAAAILAGALERDGDAEAAAMVRSALTEPGTLRALQFGVGGDVGDWRMPGAPIDALILDGAHKEQFERLVRELEAVPRFVAAGIDAPTRIFFDGPSGTGKTLAAQHLAERLGIALLIGRLDQIVDSHLGESSKKLAKMFQMARTTPCVVFIDEIDGIVSERGLKSNSAEQEGSRTTSSLLQQLDMLPPEQIVIAASNFPEHMDGALYRRFPTHLSFACPSLDARIAMLRHWWRNLPMGEECIGALAGRMPERSGSDLRAAAMEEARAFILADQPRSTS
jgi:AAA+ superfamily predicted ATPase